MVTFNHQRIVFQHMIELVHCGCVFCSAEEVISGRNRLYLIFKQQGRVYSRNGLKGTWDEVIDSEELETVRDSFTEAVEERKIPCFVTSDAVL